MKFKVSENQERVITMNVVYRHYDPDQGLEEIQARIYTEASGLPATAEQIKERNMRRDPKTTRYALTEKGEPLAYITARDSSSHKGRTYLGYPWALPGCPSKAREKIFRDLLAYLEKREETTEIATTVVLNSKIAEEQIAFFQEKGFAEKERLCTYSLDLDVTEISKWEMTDEISSYSSRLATVEDLNLLIEICQADPYMRNAFPTQDASKSYFEKKVLKDGHAVLILQGDQIVAASAALRFKPDGLILSGEEERILMRFSAMRPGHPHAWNRLVIELAKECLAAGWVEIPLRAAFHFITSSPIASFLADLRSELDVFEIILAYKR